MPQQNRFRKTVSLTEGQSRRLHELSQFDGLDPIEHASRAIDEYLRRQKTDLQFPKADDLAVDLRERFVTSQSPGAFWFSGKVGQYDFSALISRQPAKLGIEKGRVLKLSIWDPAKLESTNNFIGSCIVNYDRGWDIRPSKIAEPYYQKVRSVLDESARQIPSAK